jgi:hypothetical protein
MNKIITALVLLLGSICFLCEVGAAEVWVARYNGPGNSYDWPYAIATDKMGNVYVTGGSIGQGTEWDFATIKYDTLRDNRIRGQVRNCTVSWNARILPFINQLSVASHRLSLEYYNATMENQLNRDDIMAEFAGGTATGFILDGQEFGRRG